MNITITGNLGGGKSSVCKELEKYGFKIITGGGLSEILQGKKVSLCLSLMNLPRQTAQLMI